MICIDVFINKAQSWMQKYKYVTVSGPYGNYFTFTETKERSNTITRECRNRHIKYRTYDERWGRSENYREDFFKKTHGPYTCRYCGKKLAKRYMVIDHIVPVAKTKKSFSARFLLSIQGIHNVNNVRNLAPSCSKCNRKKSDKMGFWLLRGWFGKNRFFRIFFRLLPYLLILSIILLCCTYFHIDIKEVII